MNPAQECLSDEMRLRSGTVVTAVVLCSVVSVSWYAAFSAQKGEDPPSLTLGGAMAETVRAHQHGRGSAPPPPPYVQYSPSLPECSPYSLPEYFPLRLTGRVLPLLTPGVLSKYTSYTTWTGVHPSPHSPGTLFAPHSVLLEYSLSPSHSDYPHIPEYSPTSTPTVPHCQSNPHPLTSLTEYSSSHSKSHLFPSHP